MLFPNINGYVSLLERAELGENDDIFKYGANATNEPGEICEDVFLFEGVEENLRGLAKTSRDDNANLRRRHM
jgi:hypothetical protein